MCFPFLRCFKTLQEFRRSIKEVKSNLRDIKNILEGTLKISQDIEDVTSGFKNVVEFYSEESKNVLRDQLSSAMTEEGQTELYHRDFKKYFKLTFEYEITKLVENHTSKHARIAIFDIVEHNKQLIQEWKRVHVSDVLILKLLSDIEEHLDECMLLYEQNNSEYDLSTEGFDNTTGETDHVNIKIFCDKQKAAQTLESLLNTHMKNAVEGRRDVHTWNCYKSQDLVYRERATRIRKLRHYLTTKIKVRKIGQFYKEEISFQINLDLKKASESIWESESIINAYCDQSVKLLQQLPKQRFTEVLEEEGIIDLQKLMKYFERNSNDKNVLLHNNKVIETENNEALISQSFNVSAQETQSLEVALIESLCSDITLPGKPKDNQEPLEIKELSEQNKQTFLSNVKSLQTKYNVFEKALESVRECNEAFNKIKTNYEVVVSSESSKHDKGRSHNECIDESYKTRILNKTIIIDPNLIYKDVETLARPFFNFIGKTSTKFAIHLVDHSHVVVNKAIDVLGNIDSVFRQQERHEETRENLFLKKIIELIAIDLDEQEIIFARNFAGAFHNTKANRKIFLDSLEERVPRTAIKFVERGNYILKDYGTKLWAEEDNKEMMQLFLKIIKKYE